MLLKVMILCPYCRTEMHLIQTGWEKNMKKPVVRCPVCNSRFVIVRLAGSLLCLDRVDKKIICPEFNLQEGV